MSRPKILLYVDTVSPFAYQAYWLLRASNPVATCRGRKTLTYAQNDVAFKKCDVTFVPIFLGGVMMATGNTAPIKIKNKDKWIEADRKRWAKAFNIPMKDNHPPNFPPLTLYIMRALAALTIISSDQEMLCKALDGFFEEFWCKHTEIHKPEIMERILIETVGEDMASKGLFGFIFRNNVLIRVMSSRLVLTSATAIAMGPKEGKALLLKNTDQALADGAFGLPWMVCTNAEGKKEGFWGVDHFGQVVDFLGIDRPKQTGWKALL
jgi:2-hydroxychromene-2-carboxylate isomerase